jgi:uncharacterized protein YukE
VTINPLVAARVEGPKDAWAGVWLAEDIELIKQGIENKSWVDGTLGVVGAGLDALALISDPVGVLLQYGVAWIIEHVKPLSEALDWLAGDPAQIAAHAQTWRNVGKSLAGSVTQLSDGVSIDVASWHGSAGDAYRAWAKQQRDAIAGLAKASETMASITEGAGFLIAAVRVLVRDAIATCVSRLITYAAEELFSFGAATPLVVEQVTTLIASWAAKIARWLKALLASLRRLMPIIRRLGQIIEELKKILGKLRSRGPGHEPPLPHPPTRQELLDELKRLGIKHNPDAIVKIGKDASGKIIFLEKGNAWAGLQHIERHAGEFATVGIPEEKIADVVFEAVAKGTQVGMQRTRPIYEVVFEGKIYKIAVSVGDNGFIVGANPVGR